MQKLENPRLTYAKIFDVTSKTAIAAVRTRNEEIRKDQIKKGSFINHVDRFLDIFYPLRQSFLPYVTDDPFCSQIILKSNFPKIKN